MFPFPSLICPSFKNSFDNMLKWFGHPRPLIKFMVSPLFCRRNVLSSTIEAGPLYQACMTWKYTNQEALLNHRVPSAMQPPYLLERTHEILLYPTQ